MLCIKNIHLYLCCALGTHRGSYQDISQDIYSANFIATAYITKISIKIIYLYKYIFFYYLKIKYY